MTRHPGIVVRALTWNLYHGRDRPPDPALWTWRSSYLRVTEANDTHLQVNRPLLGEFAATLAADPWNIALLQEAPPRWLRPLCERARAHGALALTSRNLGAAARAWLAERNPDLIASNEGGSNQILARPPWRIADVRRLTLTFFPERRRLIWARLEHEDGHALAVGNYHGTADDVEAAERDAALAAERSLEWAAGTPLILGGDFNLRPASEPGAFEMLRERFGLAPPTGPKVIDHLLVRGLDVVEAPRQLPPEWREVREAGRAIRLSDHAAVAATVSLR